MPRNGSGQYNLPYNWNDDKANGIKVLASRMQGQDQDIADALTGSLASDGQTALSGNLDFNTNRAVDLADGQATQDAVVVGQAQTGELQYYGISSTIPLGTPGEDYEVNANPTLTEYVDGLNFSFLAHIDCLDNPVLRIDTEAELTFVKDDAAGGYTNCVAGDILLDHIYDCSYNEAIGPDKILIKNPEAKNLKVNNLTVEQTINGSVFGPVITIANNTLDSSNDIDFSSGCAFSASAKKGWGAVGLTKRLDASWVAGNNQGGLFSGSKAISTWYYCFAIYNPTTRISDFGFSTNINASDAPSGYTAIMRIASIKTNASGNIRNGFYNFFSGGYEFQYTTPAQDIADNNPGTSAVLATLISVPLGVKTYPIAAYWHLQGSPALGFGLFTSPDQADIVPSATMFTTEINGGAAYANSSVPIRTNTSSQIRYRVSLSNTDTDIKINVFGWKEYYI